MCPEDNVTYAMDADVATAHAVCSLTLALLGTVGNGLSIVLIFRGRLHVSGGLVMLLLVDLCIINMITTTIVLPFIAINSIHNNGWLFGDDFCAAFGFIMYTALMSEIEVMLVITVNQYFIVVKNFSPQKWLRTHKKLKLCVVLSLPWLPSLILIAPLTRSWDAFDYEPRKGYCSLRNLSGSKSMKATILFANVGVTLVVIILCYAKIYWTHHKAKVRTDATTLNLTSGNGTNGTAVKTSSTPSPAMSPRRSNRAMRGQQLLKMISIILINFFICYIPFLIKNAYDPCLIRTSVELTTVILYISWSHAATNPLIYVLTNRQIRSQWRRLFPCHVTRSVTLSPWGGGGGGAGDGVNRAKVEGKGDHGGSAVMDEIKTINMLDNSNDNTVKSA